MIHESPILRIAVVVGALLAAPACDRLRRGDGSPTGPTGPPPAGSTIVYNAIGASDVNGVGSSAPCLPLDSGCGGNGYVYVATRQLRAQGFTVVLKPLGLPTSVIGGDFERLGQQFGRTIVGNFIEQEMPFIDRNATVVTIFAGINEINTITAALGGGAGGSDPNGFIDAQVRAFGADYTALLAGIRARAGSPRIVILNVPNAAGLPFLANASLGQRQAAQRAAVGMTRTVVNPLAAADVFIVDLMCDARSYLSSNYSSDGLHPNDSGYAFIAGAVVRAITAASFPAPQGSCSANTIVP